LFSQSIPSQNLGFVDSKATILDLSIGDRDLTIHQSPTILSSNRGGGTTGAGRVEGLQAWNWLTTAVVWKITPLFASWITHPSNLLFKHGILNTTSTILELGCGISGVIGLTLGPLIESYILTDQEYVMKYLNRNLGENQADSSSSASKSRKSTSKMKKDVMRPTSTNAVSNIIIAKPLDWETDQVTSSLTGNGMKISFDAVIACDCIYNDALIKPLVDTCREACQLRLADGKDTPTVCIVAQQLRSAEVFEGWLKEFHKAFRVWRVPDQVLTGGLGSDSGFVIHIGLLR
jgi:Lysine methyltransferase